MAAERDEQAARATLKATEISLIAEVVSTYLSLTVANERVDLVRQQLDATSTFRDLVEARYAQGLTNAFDVYQLRQQEAQIRSTLESANLAKEKNTARRLTLLQGEVPVTGDSGELPGTSATSAAPSDWCTEQHHPESPRRFSCDLAPSCR